LCSACCAATNEYLSYDLNLKEARDAHEDGADPRGRAAAVRWQGRYFQYRTVSMAAPAGQPHRPDRRARGQREAADLPRAIISVSACRTAR
jgi:hypothetical protein